MHQLPSYSNHASVVNTDRKTSPAITLFAPKDTGSINVVDHEKQLSSTPKGWLDRAVISMSTWKTLFLGLITIPGFVGLLILGLKYENQCPVQPLINTFVIVYGCGCFVQGIVVFIGFITANYMKRSHSPSPNARCLIIAVLIGKLVYILFSVVWWVVGQVWVFRAIANGFQSNDPNQTTTYCNSTLFWNSVVLITVTYVILLIVIVVCGGRFIIKRYKMNQEAAPTINEHS